MKHQQQQHRPQGMTMIEVLIGLSLTAILVIGAATFLHSLTRTYFSLETAPILQNHADGVTRFLNYLAETSEGISGARPNTYSWATPPDAEEPTLAFRINEELPFFVDERRPLPPLNAYLTFDHENSQLWILWHIDPRFTRNRIVPHHTLISPWVDNIAYGYYSSDEKKWEFEYASDSGRTRKNEKPGRVIIHFNRSGSETQRSLDLYIPPIDVLTY